MTRHHRDKLLALAKSHPVPAADKAARRINRLERMAGFYRDKIAGAPEKQSAMFAGFVSALLYAINTISLYRTLTKKLADMAEEEGHGKPDQ